MKIEIELDEDDLKQLVVSHLASRLGSIPLQDKDVVIEVKSKQNYKSEWEPAKFRARLNKPYAQAVPEF